MTFLIALPALACLAMVAFNAASWTRGRSLTREPARAVSVLIPARNEEENLAPCVRAALASAPAPLEVRVYDDESTDRTPERLAALAAADPRVLPLKAEPLPPGWVGKPHACHRLGEAARGDVLLFLDADVHLSADGVGRVLSLLEANDVVTAVPRQKTGSWFERLVVPLLHVTYMAWLPLVLIPKIRDPRVLAANGQVLAMTRRAFEELGGYAAIRDAIVDDMALCRRAKALGLRVVFADGHHLASCRMYRSARGVWEGFSKNLYLGIGARPGRLLGVVALYAAAFVLPYVTLALSPLWPSLLVPSLVGVIANVGLRSLLVARQRHPIEGVLIHPIAVLALVAIAFNSFRWTRKRRVRWAGRTYQGASA